MPLFGKLFQLYSNMNVLEISIFSFYKDGDKDDIYVKFVKGTKYLQKKHKNS